MSTMEALALKTGLYFALFVAELYIYIYFKFLSAIVNIVLHVILFQSFEYHGLIILPSEILGNQGHMTFCGKLSDLLYIKSKNAIQVAKAYYTPLSVFYLGDHTRSVYMKVIVAYAFRHSLVQS